MVDVLTPARRYAAAGISTGPARADGSKQPDWGVLPEYDDPREGRKRGWKPLQNRMPTEEEMVRWWGNGTPRGIFTVCGAVSGNLLKLDFDEPGLFERFEAVCTGQGYGDLLASMPLIETPSGGRHLEMRCGGPVPGNQKLAQRAVEVPEGTDGARPVGGRWVKVKTLIETRGEGGYTLAPGSPPSCHPSGRTYHYLRGRPNTIPTISPEELTVLLALASTLNEYAEPEGVMDAPRPQRAEVIGGLRPGDDYSARGDYETLLERHGWRLKGHAGDKGLWQRPGKDGRGISATSNYAGCGLFYVFSSNAAPFQPGRAYTPFAVYALLEHGGDFTEAAGDLGRRGFGEPPASGGTPMKTGAKAAASAAPTDAWERPIPFTAGGLPPFPMEALPPALRDYVSEVAETMQVPADMPALLALATVAAAAARVCVVRVGETHAEPLNLYVAVVMDPGSRKSASLEAMAFPLREAEQRLVTLAAPDITAAREKRGIEEKRLDQLRALASKEADDTLRRDLTGEVAALADALPPVPAAPRLLVDDVTPERLSGLMAEQGGCMGLFSAEGGIFGTLAGRYSASGQANLDLFLKGHAGEDYRADRVGRAAELIPRATLTMGLAVQPDVLASLADNASFRGRGLLGRFLYAMPDSLVGTRLYRPRRLDPAARAVYGEAVAAVLSLTPPATPDDPGARHGLRLDGAALSLWAEYYDAVERRQAEGEDLAGVRDWASKLAGAVARIAGGLHLVRHAGGTACPWAVPLSPETVAAAWAVGEYLIPHALAAFGHMGADPNAALARKVLRWIERKGVEVFTKTDCHRALQGSVASADALLPALAILCERHFIREEAQAPQPGVGRPKAPAYRVNPRD